jgi:hypothetical protein
MQPKVTDVVLSPNQPLVVPVQIRIPSSLPLDLVLLQDLSYSYLPFVGLLNSTISAFIAAIQGVNPDVYFGFSSFIDKPIPPFGQWDIRKDYEYRTEAPLNSDPTSVINAVRAIAANTTALFGGSDIPEAQLDALLALCNRVNEVGWRNETKLAKKVNRIIVVVTDAPYHKAGDVANATADPLYNSVLTSGGS